MKRLLLLLAVLAVVAAAAVALWPHTPTAATGQNNTDPRPLSATEQAAFLPLVCGGAGAGSGGYAHSCTSLPGYPSSDYGGAGTGLGITLTSVAYGNFTGGDEAYVSYQGSFEPHATNFGGGLLFARNGTGWTLSGWQPGNSMDNCLVVNRQGTTPFLCARGSTGQGETDTLLGVWRANSASPVRTLVTATDLRGTMNPNANCASVKPGQAVLVEIDGVSREGDALSAEADYIPGSLVQPLCAAHEFGAATPITLYLPVSAGAASVQMPAGISFAAAP